MNQPAASALVMRQIAAPSLAGAVGGGAAMTTQCTAHFWLLTAVSAVETIALDRLMGRDSASHHPGRAAPPAGAVGATCVLLAALVHPAQLTWVVALAPPLLWLASWARDLTEAR